MYRYKTALEKRILPVLGDIPLKDLTRLDVTNWYTKLRVVLAEEARGRKWHGKEKSDGLKKGGTCTSSAPILRLDAYANLPNCPPARQHASVGDVALNSGG
jgi:hypothetical protein